MDAETARMLFVHPFYLNIQFGLNLEAPPGYSSLAALEDAMVRTAPEVSDHDVLALWNAGWREALMASWWAGIRHYEDLNAAENIKSALKPDFEWAGYSGPVHFAGLVLLGDERAREVVAWSWRGRGSRGDVAFAKAADVMLGGHTVDFLKDEQLLTLAMLEGTVELGGV